MQITLFILCHYILTWSKFKTNIRHTDFIEAQEIKMKKKFFLVFNEKLRLRSQTQILIFFLSPNSKLALVTRLALH